MKRLVCVVAVATTLAGCVSAPTKTVGSTDMLKGKTIVLSEYDKPDFVAQTAAKAEFGLFGVAAMIHAGNELVKSDNIADPSIAVGEKIAQDLVARDGSILLPNKRSIAANDNVTTLTETYPGADLIIDVKTIGWSYIYYPTHWTTYHVLYTARLRVLDGKSGSLIAQALCKPEKGDSSTGPSGSELLAEHGRVLKELLQKAAERCVTQYEQTLKM
jgi:hypothetical protein